MFLGDCEFASDIRGNSWLLKSFWFAQYKRKKGNHVMGLFLELIHNLSFL